MKSLSVKLGVLFIGLIAFTHSRVWGTDWKFVGTTVDHFVYYDAEDITRPSKNVVGVWEKIVYTDKPVINRVGKFGSHYATVEYTLNLWEFNCTDGTSRLLTTNSFSKDGEVLQSSNYTAAEWEFIPRDSIRKALYETVCK